MKKLFLFSFTALIGMSILCGCQTPVEPIKPVAVQKAKKLDISKLKFRVTTDKSPISYKIGEKMTFTISLDYGQELPAPMDFFVRWTRTGDDGISKIGMGKIAPGQDIIVETSLDRAGFVRLQGQLVDINGKNFTYMKNGEYMASWDFDCGAGADVDKILPADTEPADFDVYWSNLNAELAKVPVEYSMTELPDAKKPKEYAGKIKVFAVKVKCAGPRPVTGFLLYPADAKPKSLPATIAFDGYGEGGMGSLPDNWKYKVAKDCVFFHINAHGYDLMQDEAYYKAFFAKIPGYAMNLSENLKPETSYFRGMAFRVIRAYDFVKTLPQWNGKDLIAQGGSQGGLQTSWAGSQVKGLTLCKPSVTWCSDIAGTTIGRLGGWRPSYTRGLNYYDTVFHARRIPQSCQLFISRAGLGDYVCPPSGLAAQFNSANCPKKISWMQNSTHMTVPPDPETFVVELPAGKGLKGQAPKPQVKSFLQVQFVKAKLSDWIMQVDGKDIKLGDLSKGKQIRCKMAPGGKDFPVMQKAILTATITAEADGYVLLGAGIDWWWNCLKPLGESNFESVFGRPEVMQGGNGSSNFNTHDWVFRYPVKKGANPVRFDVVMGESSGKAAIGLLPQSDAELEISQDAMDAYWFYCNGFPKPEMNFDASIFRRATGLGKIFFGDEISFKTAQPYPAGVEYRVKGEKDWHAVWDTSFSKKHTVKLPWNELIGKEVEFRVLQHAFYGGWRLSRSNPVAVTVK